MIRFPLIKQPYCQFLLFSTTNGHFYIAITMQSWAHVILFGRVTASYSFIQCITSVSPTFFDALSPFCVTCHRFVAKKCSACHKLSGIKLVSSHFRRSNFTSPGSQPSPFLVVNFQPSWGITPSQGGQLYLVVSKHFFPELSYTV